jgi:predicted ATPase
VQDAAYGTLLRSRRQRLHARIATTLEDRFPEIVAAQPELLAHHCTEAGLAEKAIEYWRRAGERAIERSANPEAIAHLTRGLKLLNALPEGRHRDERELMFQVALVAPHWASKGWASPGAERVATRALELCRQIGADTPEHFWTLWALAAFYFVRGEVWVGRPLVEQCLQLAERLQDRELLGYGHFLMGNILFWFGELVPARLHLEQGIALYDPEAARSAATRHGFDSCMGCECFLGRVLWHLGYPDQARTHSERSIAVAEASSQPFGRSHALSWAAALHQLRGEVGETRERADQDLALATEQVIPFFAAHTMVLRGWALVEQGRQEEGIAQLREGLIAYRATGAELERPHWLGLMAEACRGTGQIEEGLRVVSEGLAEIEQNGIRYYEAELNRLEGELRLGLDAADDQRAEACFRRAIDIARVQQAKSLELRAATSLARLWRDQGKRTEARGLLAPVYGWFTEGLDTNVLKDAKAELADAPAVPQSGSLAAAGAV